MKHRMSIYVSSPISYNDVLKCFLFSLKKNWTECPYPLCISTNKISSEIKDNVIFCSNNENDGWVERSIPALRLITTPYILMMCDDIFVSEKPNIGDIESILDYMDKNNINFCRLKKIKKGKKITNNLYYLSKSMPYAKNLQFGIYRTAYLLDFLDKHNLNAWEIENFWNQEATNSEKGYFQDVIGVKKQPLNFLHGIEKGKWIPNVRKELIKLGCNIDEARQTMSTKEFYLMNLKSFVGELFPFKIRKKLKRILTKIGFKFSTQS